MLAASLFISGSALAAPGQLVWEADYMGSPGKDVATARGLAIGPGGELAVAGYVEHADGNHNYLIIRYGPYGTTDWIREYEYSWYDVGGAVTFQKDGSIIVAGASGNPSNPRDSYSGAYYNDYRVVKYSGGGDLLADMSASAYRKNNDPAGVAADGDGNIYVTGMAMNAPNTSPVFYTVKFGPDGAIAWEKVDEWGAEAYGTAIKLDGDGNPVVAGYFKDPSNDSYSIRVLRYDKTSGRTLMDAAYDDRSGNEKAWGIALDHEGDIYVTGETDANGGTTLTLKYGPGGDLLWARQYAGVNYRNRGNSVAVDGNGRVWVVGKVFKEDQAGDWLLLAYDEDGNLLLDKTYSFGGDGSAESVAVDASGNLAVTGNTLTQGPQGQQGMIRTVRIDGIHGSGGFGKKSAPILGLTMPYQEWLFTDLITPAISLMSGRLGCPDGVQLSPVN